MAKKKIEEPSVEVIEETPVNTAKIATVTADKLNVRKKATTNSDVVKIVCKGDKFEVCPNTVDGFYEIVTGGFIMSDYVTVE